VISAGAELPSKSSCLSDWIRVAVRFCPQPCGGVEWEDEGASPPPCPVFFNTISDWLAMANLHKKGSTKDDIGYRCPPTWRHSIPPIQSSRCQSIPPNVFLGEWGHWRCLSPANYWWTDCIDHRWTKNTQSSYHHSVPPHTIISLPVHTAVCRYRTVGALVVLVACQLSVAG
jgi:hypothetical protein